MLAIQPNLIQFGIYAFLISLFAVLLAGPKAIALLHSLRYGQTINSYVTQHQAKQGTPTMGGLLFPIGLAAALALTAILKAGSIWNGALQDLGALFIVFILHVGIGFADDYLSIKRGKNLGLKARHKLLLQTLVAAGFGFYIFLINPSDSNHDLTLWRGAVIHMPQAAYAALVAFCMVGMSNFTNLTDGLDGLAGGLALIVALGMAFASAFWNAPGAALFGWALAGALVGFLAYNHNPAKVFMGDTGSLALGASLLAMAALAKLEAPFVVMSLVFIAEGLSVCIQVGSFKLTGKRVFLMAPLHHHFEKLGWNEREIVFRFWLAGAVALCLGLLLWLAGV